MKNTRATKLSTQRPSRFSKVVIRNCRLSIILTFLQLVDIKKFTVTKTEISSKYYNIFFYDYLGDFIKMRNQGKWINKTVDLPFFNFYEHVKDRLFIK